MQLNRCQYMHYTLTGQTRVVRHWPTQWWHKTVACMGSAISGPITPMGSRMVVFTHEDAFDQEERMGDWAILLQRWVCLQDAAELNALWAEAADGPSWGSCTE